MPAGAPRLRWSMMIPTYRCASYLGETLERVLAQDPGPEHVQIEVVDDHSTAADPAAEAAIRRSYRMAPAHRIGLVPLVGRQPERRDLWRPR